MERAGTAATGAYDDETRDLMELQIHTIAQIQAIEKKYPSLKAEVHQRRAQPFDASTSLGVATLAHDALKFAIEMHRCAPPPTTSSRVDSSAILQSLKSSNNQHDLLAYNLACKILNNKSE